MKFDSKLTLEDHVCRIVSRVSQRIGILMLAKRIFVDTTVLLRCYFALAEILELIPEPSTMSSQQESIASLISYLIVGLREFTKVLESSTRPRSRLNGFKTTLKLIFHISKRSLSSETRLHGY